MTTLVFIDDPVTGDLLEVLLARAGIPAATVRPPRPGSALATQLATLRARFPLVLQVDGPAIDGARPLVIEPSIEAWLTRDADANLAVLGTREVPAPASARAWLRALRIGARGYSGVRDGRALAERLDLGVLVSSSRELRELLAALRPGWASGPMARRRGRPPGVAWFRGSGYALCLELLHVGDGSELTAAGVGEALRRTKTPVLRLLAEGQRRGYLRRTSARGPLVVVDTARLLDDLVTAVRAQVIQRRPATLALRADRDPDGLTARLARSLAAHGRGLALTGAPAVSSFGGDLVADGPVRAYANLHAIEPMLGDAHVDPHLPRVLLVEPYDEAVLHRMQPGAPALVSPWQAVIDLLTSDSERERAIGREIRRRLEDVR